MIVELMTSIHVTKTITLQVTKPYCGSHRHPVSHITQWQADYKLQKKRIKPTLAPESIQPFKFNVSNLHLAENTLLKVKLNLKHWDQTVSDTANTPFD